MNKLNIIVCDTDAGYVQAFVSYLLEKQGNILAITSFTDVKAYLQHQGVYEVGLLSEEFLQAEMEGECGVVQEVSHAGVEIRHQLYLCEEAIRPELSDMTQVFKYQSMHQILTIMQDFYRALSMDEPERGSNYKSTEMIGIYSPISHELQMPYALTLAKIISEDRRTLFIDLEDLSILQEFMEQPAHKNLYDLFYLMEGARESQGLLSEYVISCEGLDVLSGFAGIDQMSGISESQWQKFMELVVDENYEAVVLLFGRVLPGFSHMLKRCSQILLVNKPGEYYQKCQWIAWEFLQQLQMQKKALDVSLPMSAMNLAVGMYVMEELQEGNMGRFIRRQLATGDIAIGR